MKEIVPSLLIVDDQPSNLLALEAILEPLSVEIIKAGSGAEALKRVLERDFAAILLDVQMPEMDGFETAQLVRSRERSRHVPILFLTAISKEAAYVARGYDVGAVDYLLKPFEPDMLRAKVSVFVELFKKNAIIAEQAELLRLSKERELADLKTASEQRYLNLAESMPQLVWVADGTGQLTYCNGNVYDCAGVPRGTPLDWEAILHPDDLGPFLARWGEALKGRTPWEAELRFGNAATNSWRWHLIRVTPIRGEKGTTTWIGASTDIQDRRQVEEGLQLLLDASQLLAAGEDLDETLEEVASRVVPWLGDGCIIDLRSETGGISRRAAVGPASVKLDDPRLELGPSNVLLTGEAEIRTDIEEANLDSTRDVHAKLLRELGIRSYITMPMAIRERVLGALTVFSTERRHDASALKVTESLARRVAMAIENAHLQELAAREREMLEEANRAKDVFLATLSHELRTPLNAIMGWTQILRAGGLDGPKFQRALDTIERNAKSQAQLVADLLDVSRIITGKLKVDSVPVQIVGVVEGAVDAARPTAEAKRITIESAIDATCSHVVGDSVRLQQVVGNLLSNAIKFTPAGGHVMVTLERKEGRALLAVKDSGQGIGAELLPFVFDRFRQGDTSSTRTHGGLGLGLAIVKHLVEMHGGRAHALSEGAGKGATFVVELPLSEAAAGRDRHNAASGLDHDASIPPAVLDGVRVLVVEDDPDGRELVEMVLSDYGAQVSACGSVGAALQVLSVDPVDIVVSDIGLPGEDGLALIRKLRSLPRDRGGALPAVAVTAYASREDTQRVLEAGFDAHIAKPVDPGQLAMVVARLAGRAVDHSQTTATHREERAAV